MSSVRTKLLLAAGLAAAFVFFRLIYAVVFSAAGFGNILIDLPGLRLSGIFSHVTLFGPIGDLGLLRAIELALPFAATILLLGAISAFVAPRHLISLAAKSRSGLIGALAIGLATLPALLEAAGRVARAVKLRSEKAVRGLIPLLEIAIERASNAGIRFALLPRSANPLNESVSIKQLSLPGVFGPIDLELTAGDVVVLSGPTGVGKTSFLEALLGLSKLRTGRAVNGSVSLFGHDPAKDPAAISGLIGYLPQQPRAWFLGSTVSEELSTPALDWASFEAEALSQLSEGQAVKLGISNALSHGPKLLVLDEPFAALDAESASELNEILRQQRSRGVIVVIAEHQLDSVAIEGAKYLVLNGTLSLGKYQPEPEFKIREVPVVGFELLVNYSVPQIRDLALPKQISLYQGMRIAILGPNGSGKTTLLTQLAKDVSGARLVPELVEDFFVCQSVEEELARADKVAGQPVGLSRLTLESLIPLPEGLLGKHPRDLSAGTKLALAIAMQLSHKPRVLLIDEPVKGLDPKARSNAAEVLACVAETGCAVLFATHDPQFAKAADESILLSGVRV